jgi:uroporphyrinogen-III decarboxylase
VSLLKNSSPDDCFRETARILQSGIKEGGRFILKEANNLPPCVPPDNLAAVYRACHEFGTYD